MMKMRLVFISMMCAACAVPIAWTHGKHQAGRTSIGIGQPYRIYPSNVTQTETFIVRHPHDANILFASANTINLATGFISEGIYVTTDGGVSWWGNDTCTGALITAHGGEPAIAIDRTGRLILVRYGFNGIGLYSHYSTNYGRSWSSQRTITTSQEDRPAVATDGIPTSPFYGRTYATWVRFASPYRVYFTSTTDGAANWSTPQAINNPVAPRSQGVDISIGPNGRVNVCWAALIGTSPFTEDYIGFATSTDGGVTWTVTENAFDVNGIQGTFPQKSNIRVNGLPRIDTDKSGGPHNGWIYIVTTQRNLAPAGSDPDIIFRRSTDNGQTWSAAVRVNSDPLNNGKSQYFPAIHVDDFGAINVLYYDDRETTSDSATVYLSRSADGGDTWRDYRVINYNFKPSPIGGFGQGYQGDNIGMTSTGNTLWPVWMDNSSGIYQIWTCPIDITTLDVDLIDENLPDMVELHQNFPNPFNPTTQISFSIRTPAFVTIKVFDMLGQEVGTLVKNEVTPGRYAVRFSGEGLPSGVYIYELRASDAVSRYEHRQARKMVLMR